MTTSLEETLYEREECLHSLLEAASLGMILVGEDGRMLQVNPTIEQMFGYTEIELRGQPLDLLLPAQLRTVDPDAALYKGLPHTKTPNRSNDLLGRRKDGQIFPAEVSFSALQLQGQAVMGLVIADITERKRIEQERDQLFEQVRIGRGRLQALSRQLIRAQEDERKRLARELHDEIGQSLTAAQLNLQLLLALPGRAETPSRLEDSLEQIDRVLQQVRALSLDLRPAMLDDLGLVPALRWYIDRQAERAGIAVHFVADPPALYTSSELETTCFRIAQEAVTNIVRHARAQQISVELRQCESELHLVIRDNGEGFDLADLRRRNAAHASLGLLGMQERALLIGGQVQIESVPGRGTCIHARFLLPGPSGHLAPIERRKARR